MKKDDGHDNYIKALAGIMVKNYLIEEQEEEDETEGDDDAVD